MTRRRAAAIAHARVVMDAHLLDAVAAGATRRIVYVAATTSSHEVATVQTGRRGRVNLRAKPCVAL